jgi:hypothetical protein
MQHPLQRSRKSQYGFPNNPSADLVNRSAQADERRTTPAALRLL